jgi:hypothetical protein
MGTLQRGGANLSLLHNSGRLGRFERWQNVGELHRQHRFEDRLVNRLLLLVLLLQSGCRASSIRNTGGASTSLPVSLPLLARGPPVLS